MVYQVHSLATRQRDTLVQQVREGLNDTADSFLAAIERGEAEVAPSSLYAETVAGYLRVITGVVRWCVKFTV